MNITRHISKIKRRISPVKHLFLPTGVIIFTILTTITLLTLFATPRAPRLNIGKGDALYTASSRDFSTTIGKKDGTPAILFSRGESQLGFVLAAPFIPNQKIQATPYSSPISNRQPISSTRLLQKVSKNNLLSNSITKKTQIPSFLISP